MWRLWISGVLFFLLSSPVSSHLKFYQNSFQEGSWILFAGLGHIGPSEYECSMHYFEDRGAEIPTLMLKIPKRQGWQYLVPKAWLQKYPILWIGTGFGEAGLRFGSENVDVRFFDQNGFELNVTAARQDINKLQVFVVPQGASKVVFSTMGRCGELHMEFGQENAVYARDGFREVYLKMAQWCGANPDGVVF